MRYVPVAMILAALGFALVDGFFSPDAATSYVVLALVLSFAVLLLVIVVRGIATRPRQDRQRIAALALGAVALLAAAPWVAPIFPGLLGDLMVWAMAILTFLAVFLMARTLSPGLAIGASVLVTLALTWAAGWSAMLAYEVAWQGLNIRDVSGIDQGDGFGLALAIVFYTAMSPFLGFLIGLLSQIGKQRGAASVAS